MAATVHPAAPVAALTRRVTTLAVAAAALLVTIKAVVWFATGSVAVLASAADSAIDLFASAGSFLAVRYAATPPDAEHRFGHGKAEAFASLLQAGLVFASAAVIAEEGLRRLVAGGSEHREGLGMAAMAASSLVTLGLVWAQGRALAQERSVAVSADRTHYAADLAANVIALVGLAAARLLHAPALDAGSGLLIGALLVAGAVRVFREAADQLMDHELPEDERREIIALACADPLIVEVHQLRTRAAGPTIHVQMHASLPPEMSLEAAHRLLVQAERRILRRFPTADILIHPDPEGSAEPHGVFEDEHAEVPAH